MYIVAEVTTLFSPSPRDLMVVMEGQEIEWEGEGIWMGWGRGSSVLDFKPRRGYLALAVWNGDSAKATKMYVPPEALYETLLSRHLNPLDKISTKFGIP